MKERDKIKIGLVGHGTGGHFYGVIAVAESINKQHKDAELVFFGPDEYDSEALEQNNINFSWVPAGKMRNYLSWLNEVDIFKIIFGFIIAFFKLLFHYPDVIFSKGGYAAFPVLVAARLLFIPIVIHDSDIVPGRVSLISEKWAKRVALAWPQALEYVTNTHSAIVGNPIRNGLLEGSKSGGREFLRIPEEAVVLLVLGGSQGAQRINDAVISALPKLLKNFYVIHQTGNGHIDQIIAVTNKLLDEQDKERYQAFGNLNETALAKAYGAADVIVTRAGAGGLFETAAIGQVPAFIVPITNSVNDHQRKNAYEYQKSGAGIVIEESNLKPDILVKDIEDLLTDKQKYQTMKQAAKQFSPTDAADKIASEIIQITHEH